MTINKTIGNLLRDYSKLILEGRVVCDKRMVSNAFNFLSMLDIREEPKVDELLLGSLLDEYKFLKQRLEYLEQRKSIIITKCIHCDTKNKL